MIRHAFARTLSIFALGVSLALLGCTESSGGQRSSIGTPAGKESFWASFEQNCEMAGLKLVRLRLPSGWAMRCWGNESACTNWVTSQLTKSRLGLAEAELRARVIDACDDF
jgi:hypothetical protein